MCEKKDINKKTGKKKDKITREDFVEKFFHAITIFHEIGREKKRRREGRGG